MGSTWVVSAPGGPHAGPKKPAIRDVSFFHLQDFGADITLRQVWIDHRLAFADDIDVVESIGVPDRYYENIWLPDTYIVNGKQSALHYITKENKMFRVYKNGTVIYSQRYGMLPPPPPPPGQNSRHIFRCISWMKSFVFRLTFQWSLFLMTQWTIIKPWFR